MLPNYYQKENVTVGCIYCFFYIIGKLFITSLHLPLIKNKYQFSDQSKWAGNQNKRNTSTASTL